MQNEVIRQLSDAQELLWINPRLRPAVEALAECPYQQADVDDAEMRLERFAPFLAKAFPETAANGGRIESPLVEIDEMKQCLNTAVHAGIRGKLLLKMDSHLAVAGSVKARGGIYEILKHTEELALQAGMLKEGDDYSCLTEERYQSFFHNYTIQVGSTGNLGLSIGILSAAIGYRVFVHMSADARQWKKDLLRSKGVTVVEYSGDYSLAVERGRKQSEQDPNSYFVDDEKSVDLLLGYAVAARRLQAQLAAMQIPVDGRHPLFVSIPCGVGGAPGGICLGLKQCFGDDVHVFFAEPTQAPCMTLGLVSGKYEQISVQEIGLTGKTHADGLAVGRASAIASKVADSMVSGCCTVADFRLYEDMRRLLDTQNIFIEPSACAAFRVPEMLFQEENGRNYLEHKGLMERMDQATHIVWATGGGLVPEEIRREYIATVL